MKKDKEAWRDLREGAYILCTNLQADSAEQMWSLSLSRKRRSWLSLSESGSSGRVSCEAMS
jgi:hypothetical protein